MYLREVASRDFVLLRAEWPAGRAYRMLRRQRGGWAVVTAAGAYYLVGEEALLALIGPDLPEGEATPVATALALADREPAATADAYDPASAAPVDLVVLEEGRVIGFTAAPRPSTPTRSIRGAPPPPEGPDLLRQLVAEFPSRVAVGATNSLLVSLTGQEPDTETVTVAARPGTVIDIVVQCQRGFIVEGSTEGRLTVEEGDGLPIQFRLRAVEEGSGRIRVLAFQEGSPVGALTLAPVVGADAGGSGDRVLVRGELPEVRAPSPDLELLVLEQGGQDPSVTFRLTAADPSLGFHLKPFGPVALRMRPLEYFNDFFADIESYSLATPDDRRAAQLKLAAKGAHLFQSLVPDDLRRILWDLRDRIRSIRVDSDEPWIPWELCKLVGGADDRIEEGPFLCEAYDLTRWIPGIALRPHLTLNKMALVVPADSGLAMADEERELVLGLAGPTRVVEPLPATYLAVHDALSGGTYDGWHFTGHGAAREADPNRSTMVLESGEALTPEELTGVVTNLGRAQPLVFLNACQIGRGGMSLTDIGGWGAQFLRAGAAAFIGAYWSVFDRPAHDFAAAFYRSLLAGTPIAQAAREARAAVRPLGDPTWLAYTVFADPSARVG